MTISSDEHSNGRKKTGVCQSVCGWSDYSVDYLTKGQLEWQSLSVTFGLSRSNQPFVYSEDSIRATTSLIVRYQRAQSDRNREIDKGVADAPEHPSLIIQLLVGESEFDLPSRAVSFAQIV
jgi:hypothetical protein